VAVTDIIDKLEAELDAGEALYKRSREREKSVLLRLERAETERDEARRALAVTQSQLAEAIDYGRSEHNGRIDAELDRGLAWAAGVKLAGEAIGQAAATEYWLNHCVGRGAKAKLARAEVREWAELAQRLADELSCFAADGMIPPPFVFGRWDGFALQMEGLDE
jgi:hypothetical protein